MVIIFQIDTTRLSDLPCHTAPASEANGIDYHNEKALVGIQPSTSKKKKSFSCPHGLCHKTFTTKYRLKSTQLSLTYDGHTSLQMSLIAHINGSHTARELQHRYFCQQCRYETVYKTDLTRHRRSKHRPNSRASRRLSLSK